MRLFDFLKKENNNNQKNVQNTIQNNDSFLQGKIELIRLDLNNEIINKLKQKYIAFDIETTGLDAKQDRIVEIGAVLFQERKNISRFETLVNPDKKISDEAMKINNISNTMVKSAPLEFEVYPKLVKFLEEALTGNVIICAHNANFDISFLKNTLERLGYSGNITYIDTLSISRELLYLDNYKQETVADYFNIKNEEAHRAVSDAEVCGEILNRFLDFEIKEKNKKSISRNIIELDQYEK